MSRLEMVSRLETEAGVLRRIIRDVAEAGLGWELRIGLRAVVKQLDDLADEISWPTRSEQGSPEPPGR